MGLQDPALDFRQGGDVRVDELLDQRLGLLPACGDGAGGLSQGGGALVAGFGQGAARVAQQRLPNDVIRRHPVGSEECLRFARAERVSADRVSKTALLSGREAAQSQRDREDHAPHIEAILQLGSQPPR